MIRLNLYGSFATLRWYRGRVSYGVCVLRTDPRVAKWQRAAHLITYRRELV